MIARQCYKIILILRISPVQHCLFEWPVKSFFTLKRDDRRIVNQTILKIHVIKLSSLSSQDKLQHRSMPGKTKFSSQAAPKAFVTFNLHPFIRLISHSICILSLQDRQQVQKQKTNNIQANMHGLPKLYSSFNSKLFLIFNCFFLFGGKHTGGKQCAFCTLFQVQYPHCLSGSILANCSVHPSSRNKCGASGYQQFCSTSFSSCLMESIFPFEISEPL